MSSIKNIVGGVTSALLLASGMSISLPVQADSTGAFIGGVAAARIGRNMRDRTEAEQEQAYYAQQNAQQPVQQAAPAPAEKTAEQKLDELDSLAAGGYITPEEYKKKKQAIIDDM